MRHVVARITVTAGPITAKRYEVLSFQPFESTWRLQLTGEMEGIAAALRQAMSE